MSFLSYCLLLIACNGNYTTAQDTPVTYHRFVNEISLPTGFKRQPAPTGSFSNYLLSLPIKADRTVYLYNGRPKTNQQAQYAVLDVSTGDQDLQQCADAVMRLRAEFLFANKRFNEISFTDNGGTVYRFNEPFTREHFNKYLKRVFGMCGSASLSKQLKPVSNMNGIAPGDVFIRGGFPGHAVIVMDVAVNAEGKKIYMLAQSYMPAQDIHILRNPADADGEPWYEVNDDELIVTPEYTFARKELKRW